MLSWYRCAILLLRDPYDPVTVFHLAALQQERDLCVGPRKAPGDGERSSKSVAPRSDELFHFRHCFRIDVHQIFDEPFSV